LHVQELEIALGEKEQEIKKLDQQRAEMETKLIERDQTQLVEELLNSIESLKKQLNESQEALTEVKQKLEDSLETTRSTEKKLMEESEKNALLTAKVTELELECEKWKQRLQDAQSEDEGFNLAIQKVLALFVLTVFSPLSLTPILSNLCLT